MKKPTKKQSDAAFIKKISTLQLSTSKSKGHDCGGVHCPVCGKHVPYGKTHATAFRIERVKPEHDSSAEDSFSA